MIPVELFIFLLTTTSVLQTESQEITVGRIRHKRTSSDSCDFNAMLDVVWKTKLGIWYSTYIIDNSFIYLYNSFLQGPAAGYPKGISDIYPGASSPSALLQGYDFLSGSIGRVFMFEGSRVRSYTIIDGNAQPETNSTKLVEEEFPHARGLVQAAYYDSVGKVARLFVGGKVYTYSYISTSDTWIYQGRKRISRVYTCEASNTSTQSRDCGYENGIDAAYFTLQSGRTFFFKGAKVWEVIHSEKSGLVVNFIGLMDNLPENLPKWNSVCAD